MKRNLLTIAAVMLATSAFAEPPLVTSGQNEIINEITVDNFTTYVLALGNGEAPGSWDGCAITTEQGGVTMTITDFGVTETQNLVMFSNDKWNFEKEQRVRLDMTINYSDGNKGDGTLVFHMVKNRFVSLLEINVWADFLGPNNSLTVRDASNNKNFLNFDLRGVSQVMQSYLQCQIDTQEINEERGGDY